MKLITEIVEDENVNFLVEEDTSGEKNYFIKGIFMQAEQKNRNGRIYPKEILTREVKKYNKNYVKANRAFGELGHPDGPVVNLERVSHMIKELKEDGNNWIGKAKILDTPYGKIVKNLIDEGAKLGVSSRGMGSLKPKKGTNVVQDDFYLATAADIVADPSAPDAFVEGIMEGRDFWYENGIWKTSEIEQFKTRIQKTKSRNLEEEKIRIFKEFMSKL
jgi:hypothetical protein